MTNAELARKAAQLRADVVWTVHVAGDGHPGPALSIADILTLLYYQVMRVDPKRPEWEDRDRFLLSKGHACTILYAALADRGFFDRAELATFRAIDSRLQGHPVMRTTPGVDMTTGSLGHGLPAGAGMAAAGRLQKRDYRVYVVLGDGELNEGIVWEAAQFAVHLRLGRLTAFVDWNGYQSGGTVDQVSGLRNPAGLFAAFGWHTREVDGHDFDQLRAAVSEAEAETDLPSMIVCRTIKGKGVPFMEGDNLWHKSVPTAEQLAEARRALGVVG